jgi:hypothetical protein
MVSELLQRLRTQDDLEILRGELDVLRNAIYQSGTNYSDVLKNEVRGWVSEIIGRESKDRDIKEYFDEIDKSLSSVPVLAVAISFEPSEKFVEKLSTWLKENISKDLVVDILFNTQLIGGIQLSFRGKYLDLSLRKKIAKELEAVSLVGSNK